MDALHVIPRNILPLVNMLLMVCFPHYLYNAGIFTIGAAPAFGLIYRMQEFLARMHETIEGFVPGGILHSSFLFSRMF